MSYNLEGSVHKIFSTEQKSDSFRSRDIVIDTGGQYPQKIKAQFVQDRCELLNQYKEGDQVRLHFDLRGNEWENKFYVSLNAWKIERTSKEISRTEPASTGVNGYGQPANDDLPF